MEFEKVVGLEIHVYSSSQQTDSRHLHYTSHS
ncbi:uncharacterized protein METZ01_LOCUS247396 [marine metagenome]|uniref:Uncharacterized protein n=1 Tax=marine metagenome TaxID=408172 RepID=A0A382I5E5_9ZZZZ